MSKKQELLQELGKEVILSGSLTTAIGEHPLALIVALSDDGINTIKKSFKANLEAVEGDLENAMTNDKTVEMLVQLTSESLHRANKLCLEIVALDKAE